MDERFAYVKRFGARGLQLKALKSALVALVWAFKSVVILIIRFTAGQKNAHQHCRQNIE